LEKLLGQKSGYMTYYQGSNSFISNQSGNVALRVAVFFVLVLLTVVYLAQTNQVVAKNFELRAVQQVVEQKQAENQTLTIDLMQSRSLSNLEGAAKSLNLVAVDKINYLKILPGFLALSQ